MYHQSYPMKFGKDRMRNDPVIVFTRALLHTDRHIFEETVKIHGRFYTDIQFSISSTFWGRPSRQFSSEFNTDHFWTFQFPRNISHYVDSISTSNTNTDATEATTVDCVTVSTDQQTSRIHVIFKQNLKWWWVFYSCLGVKNRACDIKRF